jgi:hypothetical protein
MDGSRGKKSCEYRENEVAVEKDFRGMLSDVFSILHATLVSHILPHPCNIMWFPKALFENHMGCATAKP